MRARFIHLLASKCRTVRLTESTEATLWRRVYPQIIYRAMKGEDKTTFSTVLDEQVMEVLVEQGFGVFIKGDNLTVVEWSHVFSLTG